MYVKNNKSTFMYTLQKDTFTEKIDFNLNYTTNVAIFEHFFNNYICPELFTKKIMPKVIARSVLKDIVDASTCTS